MEVGPTETGPPLGGPMEPTEENCSLVSAVPSAATSPTRANKPSATSDSSPLTTTADATDHDRIEDVAFGNGDTRKGDDFSSGRGDSLQWGNCGVNTPHPQHKAGGSCEIFDGDTRKGNLKSF